MGFAALAAVVIALPMFAAFEAHVVNVTARIENALTVPVKFLDFGTVFPQEYLVKDLGVSLSGSFLEEPRVDDVEYFVRQKPKCAITWNNGQNFDATVGEDGTHIYTATGHIVIGDNPATQDVVETSWIDCGPAPRDLNTEPLETWGVLPSLCPYLSKHKEDDGQTQETQINAFHVPYTISSSTINWLDAKGYLTKAGNDTLDTWKIDLAVPCFGGYCAQDWETFVHSKNPDAVASEWTQPIANEHKVFGCDLWVEVSGVSLAHGTSTPQ